MRIAALLVSTAAFGAADAFAQSQSLRGSSRRGHRSRQEFRVEVQLARERAYAIFNELNSTDDFDVTCNSEMRTGSRVNRDVCAAKFEGRISSRASKDYLFAIRDHCGGQASQDCMFDPSIAGHGLVAAKAVEGELPRQRALLNEQIHRLARTDLRFGQAILDFYDASVRYDEERKRPRERGGDRERGQAHRSAVGLDCRLRGCGRSGAKRSRQKHRTRSSSAASGSRISESRSRRRECAPTEFSTRSIARTTSM